MKRFALVMAGGVGSRSGARVPKQFVELDGVPILWRSVRAFLEADPSTGIVIVCHPDWTQEALRICTAYGGEYESLTGRRASEVAIVAGGDTRTASVARGLEHLTAMHPESGDTLVAVHDAARPLVTPEVINRCWEEAAAHRSAVPVTPVTDSLRSINPYGSKPWRRDDFRAVQTPQVFRHTDLADAYRALAAGKINGDFTDDASLVQTWGLEPHLTGGDPRNFKVTNPDDFAVAELFLRLKQ